jgi:hypothetical protein
VQLFSVLSISAGHEAIHQLLLMGWHFMGWPHGLALWIGCGDKLQF